MPGSRVAPHAVLLREIETLAAVESHWKVYDSAPSLARLDAFMGRPAYHFHRLRVRGYISRCETRLTGKGARTLYAMLRKRRWERRAA